MISATPFLVPDSVLLREMQLKESIDSHEQTQKKVEDLSRKFVGTFYTMMLKSMRSSLPGNPLFDGGRAEKIFQEKLDVRLGEDIASEKRQWRTAEGNIRHQENPLARQFSKSLTRSLERQIEGLKGQLSRLQEDVKKYEKAQSSNPNVFNDLKIQVVERASSLMEQEATQ